MTRMVHNILYNNFRSVINLPLALQKSSSDQSLDCANLFCGCHIDVFWLWSATAPCTLLNLAFFANSPPRLFISVFHCIWWRLLTPSADLIIMAWLLMPRPLIQVLNKISPKACPWKTLTHFFPTWYLFSRFFNLKKLCAHFGLSSSIISMHPPRWGFTIVQIVIYCVFPSAQLTVGKYIAFNPSVPLFFFSESFETIILW